LGRVGIIAGLGRLPVVFAAEARKAGLEAVAVGVVDNLDPGLAGVVNELRRIPAGRWQEIIDALHDMQVKEVYLLGKVGKGRIFDPNGLDSRFLALTASLREKNDDALLQAFVDDLEREGFVVGEQGRLLPHLVPPPGVLTRRQPTEREWRDIAYGYRIAKGLAGMDVGQACAVKDGVVLALEAIDGTDACIRRGGSLCGPGVVAMKVAKPKQDLRFDIPVIGLDTLQSLLDVKGSVLAFEGGISFVIDREELVARADAHEVAVVAYRPDMQIPA